MLRWLLLAGVMLMIAPGCGDEGGPGASLRPHARDFSVGDPAQYRQPGVYTAFSRSHQAWVCSQGRMVVVLSTACPFDDTPVQYESLGDQFRCVRCAARFSDMGVPLDGGRNVIDPRGLRRLRVDLRRLPGGEGVELVVNPRVTYAYENNEWSSRYSLHMLE